MPNYPIRLTPDQRAALDNALTRADTPDTIAALINAALTEYLAAREITYPAPNAKGWPKKADTPASMPPTETPLPPVLPEWKKANDKSMWCEWQGVLYGLTRHNGQWKLTDDVEVLATGDLRTCKAEFAAIAAKRVATPKTWFLREFEHDLKTASKVNWDNEYVYIEETFSNGHIVLMTIQKQADGIKWEQGKSMGGRFFGSGSGKDDTPFSVYVELAKARHKELLKGVK